jgi:hypothetical protein
VFDFAENRVHSRILLTLTLIVIFGYAWIGSWVLRPRLILPARLVAHAVVLEKRAAIEISKLPERFPFFASRLQGELVALDSTLGLIGPFREPVALEINIDEPERYHVSETRIELGIHLLESRGQVAKAFLKAWLMQKAGREIHASLLRLEVASDLLWAFLEGNGELESLGTHEQLRYREPQEWLVAARSFREYCNSALASHEIKSICGGLIAEPESAGAWVDEISPLGFRGLIGSMVWRHFATLSLFKRISFIKEFAVRLADSRGRFDEMPQSAGLLAWQKWLRNEYRSWVGGAVAEEPLQVAKLAVESPIAVAAVFRPVRASAEALESFSALFNLASQRAWRRPFAAVVAHGDGLRLLPGKATIAASDASTLSSEWLVWESCETPDVSDLERAVVQSRKIMVVRECEKALSANYLSLVSMGIEHFARLNPEKAFVQLKTSALRLAAKRGLLSNDRLLAGLLLGGGSAYTASADLGLRGAEFKKDLGAFRVLGAVEALEWYRAKSSAGSDYIDLPGLKNKDQRAN